VFPARYKLNSYIVFRKRLVSKRLKDPLSKGAQFFWLAYRAEHVRRVESRNAKVSTRPSQADAIDTIASKWNGLT
jgi:hypothetical protein